MRARRSRGTHPSVHPPHRRPTPDARAHIGRKRIIHTRFHRRHRRRASFTREARRPRDIVLARQPQGFRTDPPHRPVVRRPRERVKRRPTTKRWAFHYRRNRSFAFRRRSSRRTYHRYRLAASLRGGGIARGRVEKQSKTAKVSFPDMRYVIKIRFNLNRYFYRFYSIVNNDFSLSFPKAQVNAPSTSTPFDDGRASRADASTTPSRDGTNANDDDGFDFDASHARPRAREHRGKATTTRTTVRWDYHHSTVRILDDDGGRER